MVKSDQFRRGQSNSQKNYKKILIIFKNGNIGEGGDLWDLAGWLKNGYPENTGSKWNT